MFVNGKAVTRTGEEGNYQLFNITAGTYKIQVIGFACCQCPLASVCILSRTHDMHVLYEDHSCI